VTTALLFAEGRWGNGAAHLDYGAEARQQLDNYLEKETQNGGVVDGVTNMFDVVTLLPQAVPTEQSRGETTTGSVMPAFFEVWGQRTQNPTWTRAAAVGRELVVRAIHPVTGLSPLRVGPDGQALEGANIFNESGYSVGFNLALDYAWYEHDARQVDAANLLVEFFAAFPTRAYPALFSADGEALSEQTSEALVAMNGSAAAIATSSQRTRLIRDVWETPTPVSVYRFYDGVNLLFSQLYLSGRFHVY
jgi:oligosaccharide reducing-end xylanase